MNHSDPIAPANALPGFYLETYGCQMNIADSELISGILHRAGYRTVPRPEEADVILLNTCAIREHAEERVLGRLSDLARLKQRNRTLRLGLLGCMAQHSRARLVVDAPYLDFIAGPDTYRRLPELLGRPDPTVDVRLDRAETYADLLPNHQPGVRAYLTAMRGCDRFCTFCVVPYVRGRERSVPAATLIEDARQLAEQGIKEVVLLGQTVNAYRDGSVGFGPLLRMLAAVDGIERIRFTSPHPSDMDDEIIGAMATESKIQPYLHLPVQSGSNRILAAMERGYNVEDYLALVRRLRQAIPELALSTDIIVGFHGEQAADFEATLDLMKEVRYDSAFIFKYSLREHTRAFRLGDTVSEEEKARRLSTAIALQETISLDRNRCHIGHTFPVLVEGPARRGNGQLAGKTPQFKTAVFPATYEAPGDILPVTVEAVTSHSLIGRPQSLLR